jgi:hypothetical protein
VIRLIRRQPCVQVVVEQDDEVKVADAMVVAAERE